MNEYASGTLAYWLLTMKNQILREKYIHDKFHMEFPGIKIRYIQWETSN